ncbi:MAG: ornithine cyclodeaminase family protein [Halanaeroarchaeum sp.]
MVRILPGATVRSVLDLEEVLDVIDDAFAKQGAGAVERPERPHYPVGVGLDEAEPDSAMGTGLVMPAYIHGAEYFATKLVSVHPDNPGRNLPTINAQIVVNDAETGVPVAVMDGTDITSARTSAIGGLSARELTEGPIEVAVIGAGTQARWQTRAIAVATDVESIRLFDIDDAMLAEAVAELDGELHCPVSAAADAESAVSDADLVVTATTSPQPVFPGGSLQPGTTVVAIGAYTEEMQEVGAETFERAARVFADVPEEVIQIGDLLGTDLTEDDLVPFSDLLAGTVGRDAPEDIVVVESVGSAVMDAATAAYVYDEAVAADAGSDVPL